MSFMEIIGAATAFLVLVLLIMQILEKRDKANKQPHDEIQELKDICTDGFHKGDVRMVRIEGRLQTVERKNGIVHHEPIEVDGS